MERKCIGFRESLSHSGSCSNFLAIIKLLSEANENLKTQVNSLSPRNSKYVSPQIQNDIINTISYSLSEEVREVKFYCN